MKLRRCLVFFGALLPLLSCTPAIPPIEQPNYSKRVFYTDDLRPGADTFYKRTAELLAVGSHCTIYVEEGAGVSEARAKQIARNFDVNIFPVITQNFAFEGNFAIGGIGTPVANNTFAFADWLGDGDGKLCILFSRLVDGFNGTTNKAYVAGYFSGNDLLRQGNFSNECDMLHINTLLEIEYPGIENDSGEVMAHEFQHLLNLTNSLNYRAVISGDTVNINTMHVWINEGLSSAAEYAYKNRGVVSGGNHLEERINWYNGENGTLKDGNNFYVWNNRVGTGTGEAPYANLDDYATVYLFFQWLRIQTDNTIYKKIAASTKSGYEAVVTEAGKYNSNFSDWETLLKTWLAANYINADTGKYGYNREIKLTAKMAGKTSVNIYPGEAVYSISNGFALPSQGERIKYAGLDKNGSLSDSNTYDGGALLTFNTDTDTEGGWLEGITSGVGAARGIARFSLPTQAPFDKPYAISAEDMRGQKQPEGGIRIDLPELRGKSATNQ